MKLSLLCVALSAAQSSSSLSTGGTFPWTIALQQVNWKATTGGVTNVWRANNCVGWEGSNHGANVCPASGDETTVTEDIQFNDVNDHVFSEGHHVIINGNVGITIGRVANFIVGPTDTFAPTASPTPYPTPSPTPYPTPTPTSYPTPTPTTYPTPYPTSEPTTYPTPTPTTYPTPYPTSTPTTYPTPTPTTYPTPSPTSYPTYQAELPVCIQTTCTRTEVMLHGHNYFHTVVKGPGPKVEKFHCEKDGEYSCKCVCGAELECSIWHHTGGNGTGNKVFKRKHCAKTSTGPLTQYGPGTMPNDPIPTDHEAALQHFYTNA